jgi:hypothetical protein
MKYLLICLLANISFAATTGNLILQGQILPKLEINIDNILGHLDLDIENGEIDKYVGLVEEISNLTDGYKVTMSSENNGYLACLTDNSQKTEYFVSYDGTPFVSINGTIVAKNVSLQGMKIVDYSEIRINVVGNPDGLSCIYRDVLTIGIEAN